jgi:hypothetical protein
MMIGSGTPSINRNSWSRSPAASTEQPKQCASSEIHGFFLLVISQLKDARRSSKFSWNLIES